MEETSIFMVFYHGDIQEFCIGRNEETGKILFMDIRNNVLHEDILPNHESLKSIFSQFGFAVKQENLELYDSIDTYEMITLPLSQLFEKMNTNVGHNVDIYRLPMN
jgi:hypothetical protein